jgi:murein DD-endopeptidase MepM/ murein hydrolase activator NlpD
MTQQAEEPETEEETTEEETFERAAEVVSNSEERIRVTSHALRASGPGEFMDAPRPQRIVKPPVVISEPKVVPDAISELRERKLTLPVKGLKKSDLRDSFHAKRSNHIHEAIDILAPRNTPVLAVEDGTIARLWKSPAGGITIYQFDPHKKYEYYYAHLERYANGLKEGDEIERGEVIGYVGTTGNAPPNTPHLHFTIFRLTDEKRWWEGTPINPYLVLK